MAENITLEPGSKVSQDGKRYRVVDTAVIEGELIEVKPQVNRHAKLTCQNADCVARRTTKAGTHMRVSDLGEIQKTGYWPTCGQCGSVCQPVVKEGE